MAQYVLFNEDRIPKGFCGEEYLSTLSEGWFVAEISEQLVEEVKGRYWDLGYWRGELVKLKDIGTIGKWLVQSNRLDRVGIAVPYEAGSSPPSLPDFIIIKSCTYDELFNKLKAAKIDDYKAFRYERSIQKINKKEEDQNQETLKILRRKEAGLATQQELTDFRNKVQTLEDKRNDLEDVKTQCGLLWEPTEIDNLYAQFDSSLE